MEVSKFQILSNGCQLRWMHNQEIVDLHFSNPVLAVPFLTGNGVLVVELGSSAAPDNAVIFNSDGSMRTRVTNPEGKNGAVAFCDAYYVKNELTLFIAFQSAQMGCVIDEAGNVLRVYETR
jgi:hypothetical protein